MTVAHDLVAQKLDHLSFFLGSNLNGIQVRTLVLPAIVVPQCFQSTHGTCVFVLSHLSPVNSISHSGCMSFAFKWGVGVWLPPVSKMPVLAVPVVRLRLNQLPPGVFSFQVAGHFS